MEDDTKEMPDKMEKHKWKDLHLVKNPKRQQ